MTVLTRLAHQDPESVWCLAEFLDEEDFAEVAWEAFGVAMEIGDPLGQVLATKIRSVADPELIDRLLAWWSDEPRIEDPVTLLEANAALMEKALAFRDPGRPVLGWEERGELAHLAGNLGQFLHRLGRSEEALQRTEQALSLLGPLARERPEVLGDLAMAQANLGAIYLDLNRLPEALETTFEALEMRRELARRAPDLYRDDLIVTLNNLGGLLETMGRSAEAIEYLEEAIGLCRQRDPGDPDTDRHLATSKLHLAAALSDLDREQDAHAATAEAVDHFRRLATESDTYQHPLALALYNLSLRLDRPEEAIAVLGRVVEIQEELAVERPDAFQPWLAKSLDILSANLQSVDRFTEARAASERAVALWRGLVKKDLEIALPGLADSLTELVGALKEVEDFEPAFAAAEEAIAILRPLAEKLPEQYGTRLGLAWLASASLCLRAGRAFEGVDRLVSGLRLLEDSSRRPPESRARRIADQARPLNALLAGEAVPAEEIVENWRGFGERRGVPEVLLAGEVLTDLAKVLFTAGRVADAVTLERRARQSFWEQERWEGVTASSISLMEILLAWGELAEASDVAVELGQLAEELESPELRTISLAYRGSTAFQQGDRRRAAELFSEAFAGDDAYVDASWGYRYGDFLLDVVEREGGERLGEIEQEVKGLAAALVRMGQEQETELDGALASLLLGRLALAAARRGEPTAFQTAAAQIDSAVAGLGEPVFGDVPGALLAKARLLRLQGEHDAAHAVLAEVQEIAQRGRLRPRLTDLAVEQARLALAEGDRESARRHLADARAAISAIGYRRPLAEIEALEEALDR